MAAVASRYARAFADVALSQKLDAEAALTELGSIVAILQSSPDLRKVWENPSIPAEQKRRLLEAISAQAGVSDPARNFVAAIIDHRRVALLDEIVRRLRIELDQRLGITDAEVTSARELAPDEKQRLETRIAGATGKKVRAHYATDAALLGGAVVRIGSTIHDGSLRGQLHKIRQQLAEG